VAGPFALFAGPGRPGGEREVHRQRHRDVGLGDEHGAGLRQRGALPLRGRQVPVLGPFGLGGIEPAGDADRAVGHDAPLHLAGRLLGPDQDHAQRPAALGDIQQELLDRAVALARRVLVQLVQHDEHQRARGALPFLARELAAQRDADREPLRPFGQVVQVDHCHLGF
jgi:hypothetical protein